MVINLIIVLLLLLFLLVMVIIMFDLFFDHFYSGYIDSPGSSLSWPGGQWTSTGGWPIRSSMILAVSFFSTANQPCGPRRVQSQFSRWTRACRESF